MSTNMIWQTVSTSSENTEHLGELFGAQLKHGVVVELRADLGGGKTTFTRGLARGLGCKGQIQSPTFTISREYQGIRGLSLHHYDLYRLGEAGIVGEELSESMLELETVTVIEWAEVATDKLPKERFIISFISSAINPDERTITLYYPSSCYKMITEVENEFNS